MKSLTFVRGLARKVSMANEVHLSNRRVMRKIKMGKARPAIFHQFDTLVELSDGSVITRRSQAPKDELRMIVDQKNNLLWNPNRLDLTVVDPEAAGRVSQFKKRFSGFGDSAAASDGLMELMGQNAVEVQKGGKLRDDKKSKKK